MTGWTPRLIHIRGFCPYGSGAKLNRRAAAETQKIILSNMEPGDRIRLQTLEPFVQNHQLSFQVRATENDIRQMCDKINIMLATKKFNCKNYELKAVLEISPDRKKACKAYCSAVDAMKSMGNEGSWEACGRSLKSYTVPNYDILWEFNKIEGSGKWNEAMVTQCGYGLSSLVNAMED